MIGTGFAELHCKGGGYYEKQAKNHKKYYRDAAGGGIGVSVGYGPGIGLGYTNNGEDGGGACVGIGFGDGAQACGVKGVGKGFW